jgi:glycosyltransferase involved in cell wall biosynthesis
MNNGFKIVTICIPTFKRTSNLGKTLNDFKNLVQRKNINVILIDDNTSYQLKTKCRNLAEKYGVQYLENNVCKGANGARLTGLCQCRTKFVHFFDDDDLVIGKEYDLLIEKLSKCESDVIFVGGENRKIVNGKKLRLLHVDNYCNGFSGVIFRTSFFQDNLNFVLTLPNAQDWDIFIQVSSIKNTKITILNNKIYIYKKSDDSITGRKTIKKLDTYSKVGLRASKLKFNIFAFHYFLSLKYFISTKNNYKIYTCKTMNLLRKIMRKFIL